MKAHSLSLIENCLTDIEGWILTHMLKLNSDKTKVMLFTSYHNAIHRLPVKYQMQFKILMYMYKALHEQAPRYLFDMLKVCQPRRRLRSLDSVTGVRTSTSSERKFQFLVSKLCNALPAHIRESKTLNIFRKLLKTHLFSSHFDV